MTHVFRQLLGGVVVALLLGEGEGTWKIGHFLEMIGQVDPFIPDVNKRAWRSELANQTKGGTGTSEVHIFNGSSHAFSIKYSTAFYNGLAQVVAGDPQRPRPDMVMHAAMRDANNQTAIGVLLPPEGAPARYPVNSSAAHYDYPPGTSAAAFRKADAAMMAARFGLSEPTGTDADLVMEPHMFSAPRGETATAMERAASPIIPTMLSGFKIYQKSGPSKRPGLLIFVGPYGDGGSYYEREVAKNYAKKGMAVFLADYYPGTHGDTNPMTMFPALAEYSTIPAFGGQSYLSQTARAQAVALRNLEQVQAWDIVDTSKIAVFGFCFGGAMGLQMARAGGEAAVVVSFHGEYPPAAKDSKAVEMDVAMRLGPKPSELETCVATKKYYQDAGCCGMPVKSLPKFGPSTEEQAFVRWASMLAPLAKVSGGVSECIGLYKSFNVYPPTASMPDNKIFKNGTMVSQAVCGVFNMAVHKTSAMGAGAVLNVTHCNGVWRGAFPAFQDATLLGVANNNSAIGTLLSTVPRGFSINGSLDAMGKFVPDTDYTFPLTPGWSYDTKSTHKWTCDKVGP